ncbi:hypothetical protein [Pseudonocardia spirodelae]|uniref:Uncharacterized protein n=1 Tax=Pseudonocardia spirodelae TaxID=3133431 RepID=A0ABU8T7F8_9PSEU
MTAATRPVSHRPAHRFGRDHHVAHHRPVRLTGAVIVLVRRRHIDLGRTRGALCRRR